MHNIETRAIPRILGIGGTLRPSSLSEKALRNSLRAAELAGAQITIVTGEDLDIPHYTPQRAVKNGRVTRLIAELRACDGVIISSPAYHGTISGLIKNALDHAEELSADQRPYLTDIPVGCIAVASGWQAGGHTLTTLRTIVHSLRAFPTPLGVVANSLEAAFDSSGDCHDARISLQLSLLGQQVAIYARAMRHAVKTEMFICR